MESKVELSTYSIILSAAIIIALLVTLYDSKSTFITCLISATLIVLCGFALYYMPLSVSVTDSEICVNRPLRIKQIPLSEISSVELTQPTMAEKRISGSGGWFGYWGWFSERDLGKYFAYYGKSSDCFLLRLKNGQKYMLGCKNPQSIVTFINSKLTK